MKKLYTTSILGLFFIGLISLSVFGVATTDIQTIPASSPEDQPYEHVLTNQKYEGLIQGNQTNQFRFQNQFQFRIRTNTSMNLDIECDECIEQRTMTMNLNTSDHIQLRLRINQTDPVVSLSEEGDMIQLKDQTQLQFREMIVLHLELNESVALQAQLRFQTENSATTWAYYDEVEDVWVKVQSTYQNGEIICNTDHFSTWTVLSAPGPVEKQHTVTNKYNGTLQGNESNQFTFQNQFKFTIQTNNTLDLDMECDTEGVEEKTMAMNMNSSDHLQMRIRINESNSELGLQNGNTVMNTSTHQYKFMEGVLFNITTNSTNPVQAQLRYQTTTQNLTWAYFDEATEKWIAVQSQYQDGELVCDTTHFSIWTILTIEEIEDEGTSIPGYAVFSIIGFSVIVSAVLIKKMRK